MGLLQTYGTHNLVIDEGLTVTYSRQKISGSWGWVSANMSGSYSWMNEYHRYATKSFRYVGMTYAAAKDCQAAMIAYFERTTKISYWYDGCTDGEWKVEDGGRIIMADVRLSHDAGCMWNVCVRVNEDDVRYSLPGISYDAKTLFVHERSRSYGPDAEGNADEKEGV